jgi:hypothetical protein
MKLIVPFALVIVIGLILGAGCVARAKNPVNVSPETTDPVVNVTPDSIIPLNGSVSVSVAGFTYPTNLSVLLDNKTVGVVNPSAPLYMMVSEGNHTIGVCADFICELENVTIKFGRYMTLDFSERLHEGVEILQPTARVVKSYKNGNVLSVDVELINPSPQDHQMTAVVRAGYSYIDERTSIKMVDSSHNTLMKTVKAGQRITETIDLNLAGGNSLSYSSPTIEELKIK